MPYDYDLLEGIRIRRGISRSELARRCKLSVSAMRRIMVEGSVPDVYTAQRIANEFEYEVLDLWPLSDLEED